MNHFSMTERKGKPSKIPDPKSSPTDSAFDVWLNRGLHELFDDITKEPIPEELLKLLQGDKKK